MKIGIPKEGLGETRVATSPDVVKKLIGLGFSVTIEKDAGALASFSDHSFKEAGAIISKDTAGVLKNADIVFKVQSLTTSGANSELSMLKKGAVLIAGIGALSNKKNIQAIAKAGVTSFDMELMPRITRAQSMDIISSQSNLAGYKAVLDAASEFGSVFPMMMTAAGTIAPARTFIMGVGVAGLQAIATAKRLGAIVSATDVRPATKEQIESLGAKFLEVDPEMEKDAQTESGHAKQMPPEYFKKQKQIVSEHIKKQDIVITTALIPGRPAPVLVTEDMVRSMRPGSVIVDLAVGAGGNCPISELGKVVEKHGIKIVGHDNFPGRLPKDASTLYATNLLNFITPHVNNETNAFNVNWEDETISGTCVTREGKIIHPRLIPPKSQTNLTKKDLSKVESKKPASEEP
jgi:H+-translocating NAD(P) transhydrogenase subunit alpha